MRARRQRGERGSISLELLGLIPLMFLFAIIAVQVGGGMWAVTQLNEAVRQGARAQSLNGAGCTAARAALPQGLSSTCSASGGGQFTGSTVTMSVTVPRVTQFVPQLTVRRTAVMP